MNIISKYFGHLMAYLISADVIVASVDPSLLPVKYAGVIAVAGAIATAAHNASTAISTPPAAVDMNQVAVKGDTVVVAKTSDPVAKVVSVVAMLCVSLGLFQMLYGCATLTKPEAQPYVKAAVDIAVATAETKGVTAAQINSIAKQALAADNGSAASLAAINELINAQLAKLSLPPADIAAIQILETALSAAVQAQIGQNPNLAQAQAAVAEFINEAIAITGG